MTPPSKEWGRFFMVATVVFALIWLFLRSFEKYEDGGDEPIVDKRVGIKYENGSDTQVNAFISNLNQALDSTLKGGCADLPGMGSAIGRAAGALPRTCRQAFAGLPAGSAQLVNTIRPYMCNKDDTVNRKGFVDFSVKLGGSLCAPYLG